MTQPTFDMDFPGQRKGHRREGEVRGREAREVKGIQYERVTTVDRPKCTECIKAMQDSGRWFAPNPVVYVRRSPQGSMWLCYPHLQAQREKDGMAEIKIKPQQP